MGLAEVAPPTPSNALLVDQIRSHELRSTSACSPSRSLTLSSLPQGLVLPRPGSSRGGYRSQSNPDDMITLPRPIQSVGMDLHDVSGTSTGQTLPRERGAPPGTHFCPTIWWVYPHSATIFILHSLLSTFSSTFVRNIPTFDHSSTLKRRPQTSVTAADLVWVCAPPRTIRKCLRRVAFGFCGPGRKILAAAAADLVWVCAPPRTIRKWLRRLAFWILRTRAQDPCSCCCRPGVGLRPAADHPQMITTPGVLDPADPRARSLQLLLDISDKSGRKSGQ